MPDNKRLDQEFVWPAGEALLTQLRRLMAVLESRFIPLEGQRAELDAATSELLTLGIQRMNQTLQPAVDRLLELETLGFLLCNSESSVQLTNGASKTFVVDEGVQRDLFHPTEYVEITRQSDPNTYAIARVDSYNPSNGFLDTTIWHAFGPIGPFSDWTITATIGLSAAVKAWADDALASATDALSSKTAAAVSAAAVAAAVAAMGGDPVAYEAAVAALASAGAASAAAAAASAAAASTTATTVATSVANAAITAEYVRTARGDANYSISAADRYIGVNVALTAPRTFTLPAASAYPTGRVLKIEDEAGGFNAVNTLTISRAGADTINGGTSVVFGTPRGMIELVSDGVSAWTCNIGNSAAEFARTSRGDAAYTILSTDRYIGLNVAFTAPRTFTLPSAASFPKGRALTIVDEAGGLTAATALTVQRSGTDTINGATSVSFSTTRGKIEFWSDGTNWFYSAGNAAVDFARTARGDAAYTIATTDRYIAITAAFTAPRIFTLPSAASYPTGRSLVIVDEARGLSPSNYLTVARAGADTLNGSTSATLSVAGGKIELWSDGVSAWTSNSGNYYNEFTRTAVGDANYTVLLTDRYVGINVALTAARTFTLPAAASFPTGRSLVIEDEAGGISAVNTLTLARAGTDTINGGTSVVFNIPRGKIELFSNGVSGWSYFGGNTVGEFARTARGDAAYTVLSTDRYVGITAAFTAPRIFTLPSAASFPTGRVLVIEDEAAGLSPTNYLTITRAGADTINGGTTFLLNVPRGKVELFSDGVSAWTAISTLMEFSRTAVGDAAYTILPTDRYVGITAAFTAARTFTLPAASAYPIGRTLIIVDEAGGVSATNTLTIARAGTDTINGATSQVLTAARGWIELRSNGVGSWSYNADVAVATAAEIRVGTDATKRVTASALWGAATFTSVAYAASIALDMSTGPNFKIAALTGNLTLANPTSSKEGQSGIIRVPQDATGSRTVSYGTAWKFNGGTPTASTAASADDMISYVCVDAVTPRYNCTYLAAEA